MKTNTLDKVAILLFLVLLTLATLSFGGKPLNTFASESESPCKLVSFNAKRIAPRTYVNWEVVSSLDNYCFVLERSTDGITYSIAQVKRGHASPNKLPLHYSFVDELPSEIMHSYYRIKLYKIAATTGDNDMLILSEENLLSNQSKSSLQIDPHETNTFNNL